MPIKQTAEFFCNAARTEYVKIEGKKIIRLLTTIVKKAKTGETITEHRCTITQDAEPWELDEIRSTFHPAHMLHFDTRKSLFTSQILQQ